MQKNAYQMILSHKNVFTTVIVKFIWRKIIKFLDLEKLENMKKESI